MNNKGLKKRLLIIDGYGLVFRAYYSHPFLTLPNGQPLGAIYGFTSMLLKLINDFRPEYAVVVLDSKGKTFRHKLFEEYKANRRPIPEDLLLQLPIVKEAAEALNFYVLFKEAFEADDIIATLAKNCSNNNHEAIIVSSDKDLFQLMKDEIRIYDPIKLKFILQEDVFVKFGVTPDKMRELQAIIGDSSDNIPGIKGIGPKNASKLINNFGDLKGIYNCIDQIKNNRQKNLLLKFKEKAFLSWQLVGLNDNVDIPYDLELFSWVSKDPFKTVHFIKKYKFKSFYKRIEALFYIKMQQDTKIAKISQPEILQFKEVTVNSDKKLSRLKFLIEKIGSIAITFKENYAYIIVFIFLEKQTYLINYKKEKVSHREDNYLIIKYNDFINQLFADSSIKKITVNLKNLYKNFSGPLNSFEDLTIMHYCISLGIKLKSIHEMVNYYTKKNVENSFSDITLGQFFLECYEEIQKKLFHKKALHLYTMIDLPLCKILYEMEVYGIKIDINYLGILSSEFQKKIDLLKKEIFFYCGEEFNIASTKKLGKILFEKLKLPFAEVSGKSRFYATSAEILEKLNEKGYKIAGLLLKYRQFLKLKNTYTDTLPKQVDSITSRIHTTFLQTSTNTSRLSSNTPNVQNIPIRTTEGNKIRAAFIAPIGCKLISADYSQIELRILSHVANVENLKQAFIRGDDIHKQTASQIFNVKLDEVTPELRRNAKAINFGIIYGISPFGLKKNINVTIRAAADYIKKYFEEYPAIRKYMIDTINYARENLYVKNLLGRRCHIPMINNKNYSIRAFAERAAINAPMQSLTADITKMAMIEIIKKLQLHFLKTRMILQIHDELVFETPLAELDLVSKLIRSTMENIISLEVPIKVDISYGDNWQNIISYSV